MSISTTTLSGAVGSGDNTVYVASASGITPPSNPTGVGNTFLKVDDEMMFVTGVNGTAISVSRGQSGTRAQSHAASTPVIVGGQADFPSFTPTVSAFSSKLPYNFTPIGPPLTGAVIAPTGGYIHHFTGTVELTTITPPAELVSGGAITLIFDGSGSGLTWSAAGGANSIAVEGTVSQYQAVTFTYDPTTTMWYPSTIT